MRIVFDREEAELLRIHVTSWYSSGTERGELESHWRSRSIVIDIYIAALEHRVRRVIDERWILFGRISADTAPLYNFSSINYESRANEFLSRNDDDDDDDDSIIKRDIGREKEYSSWFPSLLCERKVCTLLYPTSDRKHHLRYCLRSTYPHPTLLFRDWRVNTACR